MNLRLGAGLLAAMLVPSPGLAVAQEARDLDLRSVKDGVYTVAQAQRGGELYRDACAACHMEDQFKGTFLQSWVGTRLTGLYELIRTTMPEDRPGTLNRQRYADILAYIIALNGLPSGEEELDGTKEALGRILIEWRE